MASLTLIQKMFGMETFSSNGGLLDFRKVTGKVHGSWHNYAAKWADYSDIFIKKIMYMYVIFQTFNLFVLDEELAVVTKYIHSFSRRPLLGQKNTSIVLIIRIFQTFQ